ncbi:MAG: PLP-dependent transferase [Promethearchaeota archaeon]|jgi:cystathionine beta-lyase/cystathionine gamma-synthase
MKYLPKLKFVKPIGGFHGVSAVFPKLKDVIDYEEKKIIVNQGYPRFVTHPLVKNIEGIYKKKFGARGAISCHSYETAIFLVFDYFFGRSNRIYFDNPLISHFYNFLSSKFKNVIEKTSISEADVLFLDTQRNQTYNYSKSKVKIGLLGNSDIDESVKNNFDILIYHDKKNDIGIILIFHIRYAIFKIFRRHCGFNVSSRKLCKNRKISNELLEGSEKKLKKRLVALENGDLEQCFLYPSGMAAIFASILSVISDEKSKILALGSLYVDTIRILEIWPKRYNLPETVFIREKPELNLEKYIDENTAGVIVEIPSNPLLQLVDIKKIVKISHSVDSKVIVDNTIATPYNFNPFDYNVDVIVHSTTKFLSGKNNHIGGVILTKDNDCGEKIEAFNKIININMNYNDIRVLTRNIKKFERRMQIINENGNRIANFLRNHKSIKTVYYPGLEDNPNHILMKKYLKGSGGLLSFIFNESSMENAEKFYDNLLPPILKGPSLGSEKTLLSPYVIMAHYEDSKEDLERLGFDFYLMRLSIGIENVDKIINSLKHALSFIN